MCDFGGRLAGGVRHFSIKCALVHRDLLFISGKRKKAVLFEEHGPDNRDKNRGVSD
jgi:hypothetical protein